MDDFAAWLHTVAYPFTRLLCPPGFTNLEWEWRVDTNPLIITSVECLYYDEDATKCLDQSQFSRSAHMSLVIARQEPAILAGLRQGLEALHAKVKLQDTIRYILDFHDTTAQHPITIASLDNGTRAEGVESRPLASVHDLASFARHVHAAHKD